jgi:enolase
MKIKEVKALVILDSRQEETIEVSVNGSRTSAPSGKSKGKYEKPAYKNGNIHKDVDFINKLKLKDEINEFEELELVEKKLAKKIGANTLFALEASILKAIAKEKKLELWQILNPNASVFPRIISNTIGGGAHTNAPIKADFQEFLITCNKDPSIAKTINKKVHEEAGILIKNLTSIPLKTNDENAWVTDEDNEKVLEIMKNLQENSFEESGMHLDVGIDCAASQFFKNGKYFYKNTRAERSSEGQIEYIENLARKFSLFYIEDPLDEEDFAGFSELVKRVNCLIAGDDLTVTNLERVEKAIQMEAITGLIIKPNQTGSLLEVKKVIDLCKKAGIKTIMSHRSGETIDDTIADLAFAWQCDFIKIPVIGKEREAKVDRLVKIESSLKKIKSSQNELKTKDNIVDIGE